MSWGPEAQIRHTSPPWWGASSKDRHDYAFPRERHHVAPTQVFTEFRTLGEGPRDHKTLHHVMVLELMPDGVRLVWVGLLEESLKVACRWPRLMLVTVRGNRDVPHTRAACLPVIVVIVVSCGHGPLRSLAVPLLATLLSVVDDDVGRCLLAVAWGHLPAFPG
jgi:hypothetical protein